VEGAGGVETERSFAPGVMRMFEVSLQVSFQVSFQDYVDGAELLF
jgi:hypothetical protein